MPIYACSRCCTKLHISDEVCSHCHNGTPEQVWPVITKPAPEEKKQAKLHRCFYNGIPRLLKRPRVVCAEVSENARTFGTERVTQKYPKRR